jgi:ribosomal protein S18 acetylase RimI-like enzyme
MELLIRRAGPADAAAYQRARLRALADHPTSFASSVPQEEGRPISEMEAQLDPANENAVFAAFDGDTVVATAGIAREPWPKLHHRCEIWGVWVAPSHRGKGLARTLMQHCIDHAWTLDGVRCVVLGVNIANTKAIELYRSMGFEIIGTDPCFMVVDGVVQGEHQMMILR